MTTSPWQRQPDETAKAYEAFQTYRDMGADRSLAKVGQKLGKWKSQLEGWSKQWAWSERVGAWDDHISALLVSEVENERRALARDSLEIARLMQRVVKESIKDMFDEDGRLLMLLSASEIRQWSVASSELGRLSAVEVLSQIGAAGVDRSRLERLRDEFRRNPQLAERFNDVIRGLAAGGPGPDDAGRSSRHGQQRSLEAGTPSGSAG